MKKNAELSPEQKENAKHGEAFFPVRKYFTRLAPDYPVIPNHWHDEAELTLVTKGQCIYRIDLKEYTAEKGDILFIPPQILHSITIHDCDEYFSDTYVFHMNFLGVNATDVCSTRYLAPIMNQELTLPYLITPDHPAYTSLYKCFCQISSLHSNEIPGYELALKSLLLQAVFLLLQYSNKNINDVSKTPTDKLKCVLDYIEFHYSETISVSELAKLCCFSDYHFMRFFKKHMNMTCVEYINNLRLEKSVELFEHGNTSILDVSLSVGFHNLSYFHRAFKKKYHVTPHTFIKSLDFKGN